MSRIFLFLSLSCKGGCPQCINEKVNSNLQKKVYMLQFIEEKNMPMGNEIFIIKIILKIEVS